MSNGLDNVRAGAWDFLTQREDVAGRRRGIAAEPPRWFSEFDPEDVLRSSELASSFVALVEERQDEEGLEAVLGAARDAAGRDGPDLAKHALAQFIVHNLQGRKLPLPRMLERRPELAPGPPAAGRPLRGLAGDPESALNWFREDVFYNEHHEHWHIVYPSGGFNNRLKDRQGELFLYMHEQMLARYNTERLAAGLGPVQPLDVYSSPVPESYDFTPRFPGLRTRYAPRGPNRTLQPYNGVPVSQLENWRDRVRQAVQSGRFDRATGGPRPVEADSLGGTVEASIGSVAGPDDYYGSLHNMGHMSIASAMGPGLFGVMSSTSTAVMDPVFYRWHRHIDDFSFQFQESQPPNDFSDAPDVLIRSALGGGPANSPDIILCRADKVPGYEDDAVDKAAWGQAQFGGGNWDEDFLDGQSTTSELLTRFNSADLTPEQGGQQVSITYLDQDEFVYFIRVQNRNASPQTVTVRIWLAAKEKVEDRRMWIEMDAFEVTLPAGARHVIYRPSKLSSVIKKSDGAGLKPPSLVSDPFDPSVSGTDYCDCGWPYNLLLPKGTEQGMSFRLMVMFTANDIDMQGTTHECGSVSLCGSRAERFPDLRAMGYPFCRRFPAAGRAIEETIAARDNMAARDFTIKHV